MRNKSQVVKLGKVVIDLVIQKGSEISATGEDECAVVMSIWRLNNIIYSVENIYI